MDGGQGLSGYINVAARLEALADAGAICVTRGRVSVRDKLEYAFDDMGEQKVKNIPRPVRVFKVRFDPEGTTEIDAVAAEEQLSEDDATPEPPLDPVEVDIELTFWDSVKDSDDLEMFEAYLEKYPDVAGMHEFP